MGTQSIPRSGLPWRWTIRPLIAVVVAYALITQIFAAAIAFRLASSGGDPQFEIELCAHNGQDAPVAPTDVPDRPCDQHCILCFANASLAAAGPAAFRLQLLELKFAQIAWRADESRLPQPSRYTLARPRGPPAGA